MFHPKEPLRGKTLLALERQLTEEREAYYDKVKRRTATLQRRSNLKAAFYSAMRMILLSSIGVWSR